MRVPESSRRPPAESVESVASAESPPSLPDVESVPTENDWQSARDRFPDVDVSLDAYRAYVATRYSTGPTVGQAPAFADLYLACACARGDASASRLLASTYRTEIDAVRARFGTRAPTLDETMSLVLERVLLGKDGKPPKIAEYSGRGELRGWLRVVTLRTLLNQLGARRTTEVPFEEGVLAGMLTSSNDPELSVASLQSHAEIKRAFCAACEELTSRERRMLKHAFVEAMPIDDVGALYGVHRATAARWIKRAQEKLASAFGQTLRRELALTPADYASFLRAVGDSLEVSVERYLDGASRG